MNLLYVVGRVILNYMPSRVTQLMQLLEEAKRKGDTDQVQILEQELFLMKQKADGGMILAKGGGYIDDLI